jgi:nicotinamide phosphoribosyltransferase
MFITDFYKISHRNMYPQGTEEVYSNLTPRSGKLAKGVAGGLPFTDGVFVFGTENFIRDYLLGEWETGFFRRPLEEVLEEYVSLLSDTLNGPVESSHVAELHGLGYLPLEIKALPEGAFVPVQVPMVTVRNTLPKFYWLTNYIETAMSVYLWKPSTIATIAANYRAVLLMYGERTTADTSYVDYQAHDFSFRGLTSLRDAELTGAGHLTAFKGSDCVPAFQFLHRLYAAPYGELGGSVPASEHSVMCAGEEEGEFETIRRLVTEVHPTGTVSIVADTWNLWRVLTDYLPRLKDVILAREGKVVIRPDSGDPVKIVTGDPEAGGDGPYADAERKGVVRALYDIFGGTVNPKGYKELDPHIGAIYGDSITVSRAQEILSRLEKNGFAANNIYFGVGSYSYGHMTRDTFGFAVKATSVTINGERRAIQKDPVTGDREKKSARGYLVVAYDTLAGRYVLSDGRPSPEGGFLETIFLNGKRVGPEATSSTFATIRARVQGKAAEWATRYTQGM